LEGIERVSHQLSLQQITLGHITNRIENLENFRDIQIQQKEESSPWITDAVADLNDDDEEPVIHVIHMDESNHELPVVLHEPENEVVVPEIHPCDKTLTDAQVKEIIEQNEAEEKASHEVVPAVVEVFHKEEVAKMAPVNVEEVVEVEEEEEEVVQEEEVVEEETVVKAEQPVQPEEKPESAVNVEEEEEEVVEEEEEDSGTVFEVNGVTYYRDEDNQVFSVDDEGNLSDMPIGFWKDKTQTIRFYKMK
jgi:hypothetical protein